VQQRTRRRVLRLFKRRDILPADVVEAMLQWSHAGGFSVDASVLIEARDRRGLERLLRYCARPVLALERLHWCDERHERLVYHLPKVQPDGHTTLPLTPLALIDCLAQLLAPPRKHRHRYCGVFAPNAPLRAAVAALAQAETDPAPEPADIEATAPSRWAGENRFRARQIIDPTFVPISYCSKKQFSFSPEPIV
jgi:hypothetical protein